MAGPAQGDMMRLAALLMGQRAPGRDPFKVPFTGLRNEPNTLPPFEQPGGSLPMDRYMPPDGAMPGAPAVPPLPAPAPQVPQAPPIPMPAEVPPMPPPIPVADGSVRGDINTAIQQLIAQKKLVPEQGRGSFSSQDGEPV